MPWFNVDDSFYDHPKVFDAPDCAVALWARAGSWSSRNLTDGFVPAAMPARLCGDPDVAVRELLDRGLWRRTKGGYVFHDWTDWNRSKEEVKRKRAQDAERQRRHRQAQNGDGQPHNVTPFVTRDATRDSRGSHSAQSNPIQSVVTEIDHLSQRYARAFDDDDLLKSIIDSVHERTGQVIPAAHARLVAAELLTGRRVDDPSAYVTKAIRAEKHPNARFLPPDAQPAAPAPPAERHSYKPDGSGACTTCGLPESNRRHLEAS